jgi:glycosyltransferase involved in cell wall biosynthesis
VVSAAGRHRGLIPMCGRFPMRVVDAGRPLRRGEAANVGMDAASGDVIYFLDDDDEALPVASPRSWRRCVPIHPRASLTAARRSWITRAA